MMPDKLTDKEITIKALKEILELMLSDGDLQRVSTISHTIDLINRLEAQIGIYETCNARKDEAIKHLEAEIKRLREQFAIPITEEDENWYSLQPLKTPKEIKAEAYKECIEKAKNKILPMLTSATLEEKETICFCLDKLDNLLKELEEK